MTEKPRVLTRQQLLEIEFRLRNALSDSTPLQNDVSRLIASHRNLAQQVAALSGRKQIKVVQKTVTKKQEFPLDLIIGAVLFLRGGATTFSDIAHIVSLIRDDDTCAGKYDIDFSPQILIDAIIANNDCYDSLDDQIYVTMHYRRRLEKIKVHFYDLLPDNILEIVVKACKNEAEKFV